ncbi:MAG TPA: tetratricopeptide repeat protein [Flavobacterium sp.]|jgi:tetratricopeptide (TPR) repeat protein
MATFNKRGYKAPKEKEKADNTYIEDVNVDEKDSTTAGVFSSLDETANKTEAWVEKNQKIIFSIVGVIALITVGWLLYQRFVAEPREDEAAEAMFVAQQNFQQATEGVKSDSLYALSLKGSEGQFGFVEIADKYSGTDAGNLANYYAGIAYLNTGKYAQAIESLDKFKSDDMVLSTLAIGAKGDAYAQQNKMKEALEQYEKAASAKKNDFTTPLFLLKAGKAALALGNKEDALKHFNDIKDNYPDSPEAQNVDGLIGLAQ